jgi:hypothetical protein
MFISDRDGIINLHQDPTSPKVVDVDDNRPMTMTCSFFSVLRRLYQHRPCLDLTLPILSLYITCLDDIDHEYESRKYDCLIHVGMVVLKSFDDDTRNSRTIKSTRHEVMETHWIVPSCVLIDYLFF